MMEQCADHPANSTCDDFIFNIHHFIINHILHVGFQCQLHSACFLVIRRGSIGGAAVVGLFVLGVLFIIHKQKRAAQQGDKDSARGSGDDFQRNTGNPGDWQQDAGHMDHWHYQQPMAEAPQGDNNVLSSELSAIGRPSEMQGDLRKAYHDRAELY
ncbi:hypothetical protein VM1G_04728 [Cytospora mali]|uniref:Uncharacterized protein n=1 Tax=Cytospora mali TaxID=578113 RepID=A0A194W0J0_CYTMA|nr:hypothetical protein VM1G_04728 [Valsa mali]